MFRLLFVSLLTGLWLSLEEAHCQNADTGGNTTTLCYNTSSGNTCFTTFIAKDNQPVRKPFDAARLWCNSTVPGSSLIRINSVEDQRTVEMFLGRQELVNETIITDAQRLSAKDSQEWSWVNGHPTIPENISIEANPPGLDVVYVESKHRQSSIYKAGTQLSLYRYICEHSDAKPAFVSNESATWYDARNKCLRLGGDLASITDLNMKGNWPSLKEGETYWIGLYRNKWIWNSTGTSLTYTNWKGGFPDDAYSGNQCICIDPQCRRGNNGTICENDRKWNTCKCDQNYAIVCQKEDKSDASTTENVTGITEVMPQSTGRPRTRGKGFTRAASEITNSSTITSATTSITTTISTESLIVTSPSTTSTSTKTLNATTSLKTSTSIKISIVTVPIATTASTKNSIDTTPITTDTSTKEAIDAVQFTESPSTALFESFGKQEILIVALLLVAVIFIVVAVIVVIRKRRADKRSETSPTDNTKQDETVTSVYATVVPGNKPTEVTTPAANPVYAEVQMAQNRKPSSNPNAEVTPNPTPSNITYAEVQMTQQPTPSNTTYAEVSQNPTPSSNPNAEVTENPTPSNTYAEVVMTQQPAPFSSAIYANFQPTTNEAAEMSSGVVYAGLEFSQPNGKAVEEPIYLQAMDVKPDAESEEDAVATQDQGPVYAESMKLKKSD